MTTWYSKQDQDFAESRVRGERILAPIRKVIDADYGFLTLDEVGSFIWDRIGEQTRREELKSLLLAHYDTSEAQIDRDLDAFLQNLLDAGAICTGTFDPAPETLETA
ncbi:MAG: hypothetical protein ACI97B_002052 [Verrucomicrobiales bacterium]|jgi:hypothetical protein